MNKKEEIYTEEHYIASIDLLGAKRIIKNDKDNQCLNQIKSIYKSWTGMLKDSYFEHMKIRFFSDNLVLALKQEQKGTDRGVDILLETTASICRHFIRYGYKPRGGICKGQFYSDNIFVWGSGLVEAYLIESKEAIYPRILVADNVVSEAGKHLANCLFYKDSDGKICLNYLRAFGSSKESWLQDIKSILKWLEPECDFYRNRDNNEDEKILKKLEWLLEYVNANKKFWEEYGIKKND